jgi:hypothetical protein
MGRREGAAFVAAFIAAGAVNAGAQEGRALSRGSEAEGRPLYLQVVNPADKQREAQERAEGQAAAPSTQPVIMVPAPQPRASFELPPVEVVGEPTPALTEEQRVGPYAQPRWTARRHFGNTRIYVRPPGTAELEFWLRPTVNKDGSTDIRTLYELSVGFEPRLQLDLYFRTDQEGDDSEMLIGHQVELRYALADWGKIWGNPTLYVEWAGLEQRPDVFEAKLLLGGEITERWHWGANLVGEFQLGGEREYEYQLTGGASYTLIDSKLSLGGEAQLIVSDVQGDRGDFGTPTIFLGPSVQFKPTERLSFIFSPLVGLTDESPDFRAFLVVGYEF